jgi:hypothetical protein
VKSHKLVIIGAGSAMFTQGIILDWLRRKPEGEWEISLVDIDAEILNATEKMVRRYALSADKPLKLSAYTDRRDALPGATVVVCTIGVGGRRAWEQDVFIPRKYGIFQPVGDSVMPGGISRAMRMIPAVLEIAKDVERLCPKARFINYANPMTAIVRAVRRKTSVPMVGLCIGVDENPDDDVRPSLAGLFKGKVGDGWWGIRFHHVNTGLRNDLFVSQQIKRSVAMQSQDFALALKVRNPLLLERQFVLSELLRTQEPFQPPESHELHRRLRHHLQTPLIPPPLRLHELGEVIGMVTLMIDPLI